MRPMKEQRYIALLYVKLLLIVISLQITYSLQQSFSLQQQKGKRQILSLNKSLKTIRGLFNRIGDMLRGSRSETLKTALYIRDRLSKNHWLESKKNKSCLPEIIELLICLSDK